VKDPQISHTSRLRAAFSATFAATSLLTGTAAGVLETGGVVVIFMIEVGVTLEGGVDLTQTISLSTTGETPGVAIIGLGIT